MDAKATERVKEGVHGDAQGGGTQAKVKTVLTAGVDLDGSSEEEEDPKKATEVGGTHWKPKTILTAGVILDSSSDEEENGTARGKEKSGNDLAPRSHPSLPAAAPPRWEPESEEKKPRAHEADLSKPKSPKGAPTLPTWEPCSSPDSTDSKEKACASSPDTPESFSSVSWSSRRSQTAPTLLDGTNSSNCEDGSLKPSIKGGTTPYEGDWDRIDEPAIPVEFKREAALHR